jgi:[acyl-carrier-protein] S-malonyltransferase
MAAMSEGTMAAVIGLGSAEVEAACAEVRAEGEVVVVGNVNAPEQTVVSGSSGGVQRAGELARERGARKVIPLKVSGAFHSPLMAPAAARFAAVIEATPVGELRLPLASNVTGAVVATGAELPNLLARQLESPVRWVGCVGALLSLGADVLVEVGPGTVLSGLARRIDRGVSTASVDSLEAARATASLRAAPA